MGISFSKGKILLHLKDHTAQRFVDKLLTGFFSLVWCFIQNTNVSGMETTLLMLMLAGTPSLDLSVIGCYSYVECIRNAMDTTFDMVHENF